MIQSGRVIRHFIVAVCTGSPGYDRNGGHSTSSLGEPQKLVLCAVRWLSSVLEEHSTSYFQRPSEYKGSMFSNTTYDIFIPFLWHVQNAAIPCRSQELLPFLPVMYFFLPPFSTNYSSILSPLILLSISWSTSQSCFSQIHI